MYITIQISSILLVCIAIVYAISVFANPLPHKPQLAINIYAHDCGVYCFHK